MREGLKVISIGGGEYVYVLVAWMRQARGDEWEAHGARCIRRFGHGVALTTLAAEGPQEGTELLAPAVEAEEIHRLHIRRALPCNEAAWANDCPKPRGWDKK